MVDEFLATWAARLPSSAAEGGDGDEVMKASKDEEMKVLREVAAEFKERIEENPYTKELLTGF